MDDPFVVEKGPWVPRYTLVFILESLLGTRVFTKSLLLARPLLLSPFEVSLESVTPDPRTKFITEVSELRDLFLT